MFYFLHVIYLRDYIDQQLHPPPISQIFHYDHPSAAILHEDFSHRLEWRGTQDRDIQTGAIYIHNVTFNDTGTYSCTMHRTLSLLPDDPFTLEKKVELSVVAVGKVVCVCLMVMMTAGVFGLP